MSSVALREDAEVPIFVLGKLCVEGLQQRPNIRSSGDGAGDLIIAIGETSTNRLINIQHVGVAVEAVRVKRRRASAINEMAWTVLLEEADHTAAARASIEPSGKWCCSWITSSLEEPEPPSIVSKRKATP